MKRFLAILGVVLLAAGLVQLRLAHRKPVGQRIVLPPVTQPDIRPAWRGLVLDPHALALAPESPHWNTLLAPAAAVGANWIAVPWELPAGGRARVAPLAALTGAVHAQGQKICVEFRLPGAEHRKLPRDPAAQAHWVQSVWGPRVLSAVAACQPLHLDLICLGQRLEGVQEQSAAWQDLVGQVRQIHTGPLTYAASARSYASIDWWFALDYIGVTGDFALSDETDPARTTLQATWNGHMDTLESISSRSNKPVLLLDVGYSTNPQVALDPDLPDPTSAARPDIQALCYQTALDGTTGKSWLAGIFLKTWPVDATAVPGDLAHNAPLRTLVIRAWQEPPTPISRR